MRLPHYGRKEYKGKTKDGKLWEKIVKWFGYKLHLVVDATYELPMTFKVTKASASDITEGHALLAQMEQKQPEILKTADTLAADKGYDDTKLIKKCWDNYQIKPVIDIRNMWKDGEGTHLLTGKDNVVYNYKGNVYCYCPKTQTRREMASGGFEKDRNTLKKLCPPNITELNVKVEPNAQLPRGYGYHFLKIEESLHPLIARVTSGRKNTTSGQPWNELTVVSTYRLALNYIRLGGIAKMKVRCGLALCVMLAMALGRVKENQADKMRSLVTAV